jgi:hypothetical protein
MGQLRQAHPPTMFPELVEGKQWKCDSNYVATRSVSSYDFLKASLGFGV